MICPFPNPTSRKSRSQGARLLRLFALLSSPTLLEQSLPSLREDLQLPVLNALEPVPEASSDAREERVHPEGFLVQERAHLDAQLPEADGDAC